jgi:hypothetical protein
MHGYCDEKALHNYIDFIVNVQRAFYPFYARFPLLAAATTASAHYWRG